MKKTSKIMKVQYGSSSSYSWNPVDVFSEELPYKAVNERKEKERKADIEYRKKSKKKNLW